MLAITSSIPRALRNGNCSSEGQRDLVIGSEWKTWQENLGFLSLSMSQDLSNNWSLLLGGDRESQDQIPELPLSPG